MNIQEKINNHTTLYYVEDIASVYSDDDSDVPTITTYSLSFGFYDCHYFVTVQRKDLDEDNRFVCLEGDSRLFDSFEKACENDLWDLIKERCNQYDQWYTTEFSDN